MGSSLLVFFMFLHLLGNMLVGSGSPLTLNPELSFLFSITLSFFVSLYESSPTCYFNLLIAFLSRQHVFNIFYS